ncbi:potassium channel AKT2/3-like [Anoplophora glabripennis]|uniref:potassium channel AKT2/3-like n=1 Tax=Anoplophora glabripennis TaxID=217634 RepID=UPI000874B821|nr:potassium channel AKT2/3-like [Anoplophora glabripennis]
MSRVSRLLKNNHACTLPEKDTTGLPKLPPNATWGSKVFRHIRKLFILNPNHFKCKSLFRNKSAVMEERKRHATSRYFYVIHPLSRFNMFLEATFFITWAYAIVCGMLTIWLGGFLIIQIYVIFPIRVLLILLFFNVGYIDKKTKQIVIESRKIIVKYLKTYFVFDIFSCYVLDIFTDIWIAVTGKFPLESQEIWHEVMLIIRMAASCVRINTLLNFFNNTLSGLNCNKTMRILLVYLMRTYIYVHIFALLLFLIPFFLHSKNWPPSSWLHQANINVESTDPFVIYLEALILSICYFFGVAYKYDITLLNEQMVLVLVSFIGRLYTLYLLADVLRVFGIAGVSESMYERNMYVLNQYMTDKDLPSKLQARMLKYFEFKFQRRYFKEKEIINTLSDTLRTELFLFSARKLIQKVDILKRLPNATVGAIIASMKSETYSPRDVILKLGWETNEIYFISTGTVAVLNKHGVELCHLEDGDEFGISCLVAREQIHTIVAVETTEVFIIGKNQLIEFLGPYPDLLNRFIRTAKQKLSSMKDLEAAASRETVDLLSELQRGNILETRSKKMVAY